MAIPALSQQVSPPSPEKQSPKAPELPFAIQLLETHIRFEINGDSRKEVHTIVKINNVLGAREFARLAFDYNRAFQQVEIPLVRISHASGGTSELLPSAVSDVPNPAVAQFPAYHEVRVKSVRLLGLQEGDAIEYRVITITSHHPLAPDFWLEHTFDRSGQVLEEIYELDLPALSNLKVWTSPSSQAFEKNSSVQGTEARNSYRWKHSAHPNPAENSEKVGEQKNKFEDNPAYLTEKDVAVTTFADWLTFLKATQKFFPQMAPPASAVKTQALRLTAEVNTTEEKLRRLYDFVTQRIATVDLPLDATEYATRAPEDILTAGYATPEDKCVLFSSLAAAADVQAIPAFTGPQIQKSSRFPVLPSEVTTTLVVVVEKRTSIWLDPSAPVIPFGMISANLRGKPAYFPYPQSDSSFLEDIPTALPFPAFQKVAVDAKLAQNGDLAARVKYTLRGDNELLLRVAFHQAPEEKWNDVAGLLALSDGFRGKVTKVVASDPLDTRNPFTVEYELSQPKFVDWSKKPVRIPALLPQIGLPELPTQPAEAEKSNNIELGTPLDVETQLTLHLPPGTTVQAPAGTTVRRDYATYSSKYSAERNAFSASRHINFLVRELSAERSADFASFLHAVQNDQAQLITLESQVALQSPKSDAQK
jgi:Domain of Unknown Function with PDB structure (DUF3857)